MQIISLESPIAVAVAAGPVNNPVWPVTCSQPNQPRPSQCSLTKYPQVTVSYQNKSNNEEIHHIFKKCLDRSKDVPSKFVQTSFTKFKGEVLLAERFLVAR